MQMDLQQELFNSTVEDLALGKICQLPEEQHPPDDEALEWVIAARLQRQDGEADAGVHAPLINVRVASSSQGKEELPFCDAANKSITKVRKSLEKADKSSSPDLQLLEDRLDVAVKFLSWGLQQRFSPTASKHYQDLANVLGSLCGLVEDWLKELEASRDKVLSALDARLSWLAQEVLCLEDVRVGGTVQVRKDASQVLRACRAAGICEDNDELRTACLGRRARVLEIDASDQTVKCRVAHTGDVWFALAGLAPVKTAEKTAGNGARKCAADARKPIEAAFRSVLKGLKDLLDSAVLGGQSREEVRSWLAGQPCLQGLRVTGLCSRGGSSDALECMSSSKVYRTSLVSATRLLHEIRAGFADESFQERYQALRHSDDISFSEAHMQSLQLTTNVQFAILPRYGFEASPRGIIEMKQEMTFHVFEAGDLAIKVLMRDIHLLLDKRDIRWVSCEEKRVPVFHTVGDSHSVYGWPGFVVRHHQGPMLCYNADRIDLSRLRPAIREGDAVCLCLGEIDCRCHVHKHCSADKTFRDVINEIVKRLFSHLRSQVQLLPANVTMSVYNVVPPVRAQALQRSEKLAYPHVGSDEERRDYVRYFNQLLRLECARSGYVFFDVYDKYSDAQGFLLTELSDGSVHIENGLHLCRFLESSFAYACQGKGKAFSAWCESDGHMVNSHRQIFLSSMA